LGNLGKYQDIVVAAKEAGESTSWSRRSGRVPCPRPPRGSSGKVPSSGYSRPPRRACCEALPG